jgi:mono/diheme cytochrome c family protein
MRKALRITVRILLGLVALIVLIIGISYPVSAMKLRKRFTVPPTALTIPSDSASIARGHTMAVLYGCTGCHTGNLAGQVMIDDFPFARLAAVNLTRGKGGIGATYSDADWERAIRHGIRPNGEQLMIMPSKDYNALRDEEIAAVIAYMRSVPPVDTVQPPRKLYPLARVLHATVAGELFPAGVIDHVNRKPGPAAAPTLEYGTFIGQSCQFCHGQDLAGLAVGGEPGAPPSPNLTPAGNLAKWSEADFIRTMRTGTTPAGWKLRNQYMPWQAIGSLSDDELRGIWMYVQSVPRADTTVTNK